jgi:hypothetical protein
MRAFGVRRSVFGVQRSTPIPECSTSFAKFAPQKSSLRIDGGLTFQVDNPLRETPNAKRQTRNVL